MLNGKVIRIKRKNLGYTARDIESLTRSSSNYDTSISRSYLEELERGVKKNPSFNMIVTLSKVLCCKLDDLVINSECLDGD